MVSSRKSTTDRAQLWRRRAAWIGPYLLLSLLLSASLSWPLFMDSYQYGLGGGSGEVLMQYSLKEVFNNSLRSGIFPFWNQWVESGKPFLINATSPLHLFTPLELIFGDSVLLNKVEIALDLGMVCFLFLCFTRFLRMPFWTGCLAFLVYFLEWNFPLWINWAWSQRALFLAPPFLILTLVAYFREQKPVFLAYSLVLSFLLTLGMKPEMFIMFLMFLVCLLLVEAARQLAVSDGTGKTTIRFTLTSGFFFIAIPLGFYAWQVPLLNSALATHHARLYGSGESIKGAALNFSYQFLYSQSLRTAGITLFCVLFARFIVFRALRTKHSAFQSFLGWVLVFRIPLTLMALYLIPDSFFREHLIPNPAISTAHDPNPTVNFMQYPRFLFLIALLFSLSEQFTERRGKPDALFLHMIRNFRERLWKWPLVMAGIQSGVFESIPMTGYTPIPLFAQSIVILMILFGALFHEREFADPDHDAGRLRTWFSNYMVVILGIGWIVRDFAGFPLYDLFNFVWVNPRDTFWASTACTVLFLLGVNRVIHVLRTENTVQTTAITTFRVFRNGIAILLTAASLQMTGYAVTRFLVKPDETLLAIWHRFTPDELAYKNLKERQYQATYEQARKQAGGFARNIAHAFFPFGIAGYGATMGVMDAWSYDFVSDCYRPLAEEAYGITTPTKKYPRIVYYNVIAPKILEQRFSIGFDEAIAGYTDDVTMRHNSLLSAMDPFLMELMRVGVVWIENFDTFTDEPVFLNPRKSLRRFGILPAPDDEPSIKESLASAGREDLIRLYDRMLFSDEELDRGGYHITSSELSDNVQYFKVTANKPGYLIVFDNWHPHWRITNNDTPTALLKAFRTFRAVQLHPGENDIHFRYVPYYLFAGIFITGTSVLFAAWHLIGVLRAQTFATGPHNS